MSKSQGRIAGVIAILLTALLLAGCGGGSSNSAGSTSANSSGDASAAGKKVILLTVTTSCDYCRQQGELHAPARRVAGRPVFTRAYVGRLAVSFQRNAVRPRVGNSADNLVPCASKHMRDHRR